MVTRIFTLVLGGALTCGAITATSLNAAVESTVMSLEETSVVMVGAQHPDGTDCGHIENRSSRCCFRKSFITCAAHARYNTCGAWNCNAAAHNGSCSGSSCKVSVASGANCHRHCYWNCVDRCVPNGVKVNHGCLLGFKCAGMISSKANCPRTVATNWCTNGSTICNGSGAAPLCF